MTTPPLVTPVPPMKNITLQEYVIDDWGMLFCRRPHANDHQTYPRNMHEALRWVVAHEAEYHNNTS